MNILVPINKIECVAEYAHSGAKEYYLGFHDVQWRQCFGEYSDLNRMSGFESDANKYTVYDIAKIVDAVHEVSGSLFITLNSAHYTSHQIKKIKEYLTVMKDSKVDGIIVSDLEVAKVVADSGIVPIASTMCGIYNSEIAKHYIENGIKRIILPRELNLNEVSEIVDNASGAEYEVFMMRSGCKFSDSQCLGFHRYPYGALCENIRRSKCKVGGCQDSFRLRQKVSINETCYNSLFQITACGVCAIYRLLSMSISAVKIVGRADEKKKVLEDIRLVQENIKIAKQCSSESEYLEKMVFPTNRNQICFRGNSCYFPEVRFNQKIL